MPTPSPENPNIGGLLQSLKAANQQTASAAAKLAKAAKNPEVLKPRYDSIKGNTLEENMAKETPDASVNIPPDVPVRTDPVEKIQLIDLTKASSASPATADPVSPPPDPTAVTQTPSGGRARGKNKTAAAVATATAGKIGADRVQTALLTEINMALKGIESTLGLMHTGVSRKLDDIEKANDKYYKISEKLQTSVLEEIQKITKSVGGVEKSLKEDVLKTAEDKLEGDKDKGKGRLPRMPSSGPRRRRKGSRTLLGDLMTLGGFFAGMLGTVLKKFWGMALRGIIGGIKDIFERVLPVVFNRLIPSLVKGMGAFLQTAAGKVLLGAGIGLGVEAAGRYGFEKLTGVDPRNLQGGNNLAIAAAEQSVTHLAAIAAATAALGPLGGVGASIALIASDGWMIAQIVKGIGSAKSSTSNIQGETTQQHDAALMKRFKEINDDPSIPEDRKGIEKRLAEAQAREIPLAGTRYNLTANDSMARAEKRGDITIPGGPNIPGFDKTYQKDELGNIIATQRYATEETVKAFVAWKSWEIEYLKSLRLEKMDPANNRGRGIINSDKIVSPPDRPVKQTSSAIQQGVQTEQAARMQAIAMNNVGNTNNVTTVNTSETGILASAFSYRSEEKKIPALLARG